MSEEYLKEIFQFLTGNLYALSAGPLTGVESVNAKPEQQDASGPTGSRD
jgi:hypothetical protein